MKNLTLYKTAQNNGLLAHIYEHIIAHYVIDSMQAIGRFIAVDYKFDAVTYGTTCYITIESHNPEVIDKVAEYIHKADTVNFSNEIITRAVHECAIEAQKNSCGARYRCAKAKPSARTKSILERYRHLYIRTGERQNLCQYHVSHVVCAL